MVVSKIMGGPAADILNTRVVSPGGGGGGPRINLRPAQRVTTRIPRGNTPPKLVPRAPEPDTYTTVTDSGIALADVPPSATLIRDQSQYGKYFKHKRNLADSSFNWQGFKADKAYEMARNTAARTTARWAESNAKKAR